MIDFVGRERYFSMKDGKFKNLIIDTYNKCNDKNFVGILYGITSTYGFSDLVDIEYFLEECNVEMLYLKSNLTGIEIDIFEWTLEDYKVKNSENTIYIKLKNKSEIALMY